MITIENLPIPTEREIPKEILNKVKSAKNFFFKYSMERDIDEVYEQWYGNNSAMVYYKSPKTTIEKCEVKIRYEFIITDNKILGEIKERVERTVEWDLKNDGFKKEENETEEDMFLRNLLYMNGACSTFIKERISNLKVFNSKTNELIFGKDKK